LADQHQQAFESFGVVVKNGSRTFIYLHQQILETSPKTRASFRPFTIARQKPGHCFVTLQKPPRNSGIILQLNKSFPETQASFCNITKASPEVRRSFVKKIDFYL
jgi:hypothetical protein